MGSTCGQLRELLGAVCKHTIPTKFGRQVWSEHHHELRFGSHVFFDKK